MTCIVGIEYNGSVYIGGDSAAVGGYDSFVVASPKVFRIGPYVIGYTTSFRMGQLLEHSFVPPYHNPKLSDETFMITVFMNAVRKCFTEGGYLGKSSSQQEVGGTFLVGYRGVLYRVDSDHQICIPNEGFSSVGCGEAYALGSLFSTQDLQDPERRLDRALQAAEYFSAGVRGPFKFVVLPPKAPEPQLAKKKPRVRKK